MAAIEASLNSVARGGAEELFNRELQRVVDNIRDVNTDANKKREITLKFTCTPYSDRSGFDVAVQVKSSLLAPNGVKGTVYIGRENGKNRAYTQDIRQADLFAAEPEGEEEQQNAPPESPTPRAN